MKGVATASTVPSTPINRIPRLGTASASQRRVMVHLPFSIGPDQPVDHKVRGGTRAGESGKTCVFRLRNGSNDVDAALRTCLLIWESLRASGSATTRLACEFGWR